MRVISLASGSSGNALLVEAGPQGRTRLLIDAGIGFSQLIPRLQSVGVNPKQLRGILITHEHSDHVLALPALLKRHPVPLISDPRTLQAIEDGLRTGTWRSDTGNIVSTRNENDNLLEVQRTLCTATTLVGDGAEEVAASKIQAAAPSQGTTSVLSTLPLAAGSQCTIGDIHVTSFPISHDAVAPCGYLLQAGGCRICLITDTGTVTPVMLANMQQADLLILEANHDRERLIRGPYPRFLKQRILSPTGHLSNEQAAQAILQTWRPDSVRWLWLAHLSRTNNTPTLAVKSIRGLISAAGASQEHIHISTLPPGMGHLWDSAQLWQMPSLWNMKY
jgi:phosphoribosyl 1,2-cyclic phosphodiesterase